MKRVACVHDNCGTFPMDESLYHKLKSTGEDFTCPGGHTQHFGDSLKSKLDEAEKEIERLKAKVEQNRDAAMERWDEYIEESHRRKHLESIVLAENTGVIEVGPGEFKWSCPCGGRGKKAFESPEEAQRALSDHHERTECVGNTDLGKVLL